MKIFKIKALNPQGKALARGILGGILPQKGEVEL